MRLFRLFRRRDINLTLAVSDKRGTAEFFYQPDSPYESMSGLDETTVRELAAGMGRSVEKRIVETIPLNDILRENSVGQVDFLSVDVEGHEAAVLRTLDFREYPVSLIAAEIHGSFSEVLASETHLLLSDAGYAIHARTGPTMFYVRG